MKLKIVSLFAALAISFNFQIVAGRSVYFDNSENLDSIEKITEEPTLNFSSNAQEELKNNGDAFILPESEIKGSEPSSDQISVSETKTPEEEKTVSFPNSDEELTNSSESDLSPKAPEGIVPAEINGTDGRTFHHLAHLHHKLSTKVNNLFLKIIAPYLPPGSYSVVDSPVASPHYFPQNSYYAPNDYWENEGDIYRKDGYEPQVHKQPSIFHKAIIEPIVKFPQHVKESLEHIHHSIGKRSVEENKIEESHNESEAQFQIGDENEGRFIGSSRQPKTLYRIIPNFEENFGNLMKRLFGPLYGSGKKEDVYVSPEGGFNSPAQPKIQFVNLMKVLPEALQRMSSALFRRPVTFNYN